MRDRPDASIHRRNRACSSRVLWRMRTRQIAARAARRAEASSRVASSAVGKNTKTLRSQPGHAANESASGLIAARPGEPVRQTAGASSRTPYDAALPGMGGVFAAYLVLTGAARFLVQFIRINPRSFFGLTNAQAASAVSALQCPESPQDSTLEVSLIDAHGEWDHYRRALGKIPSPLPHGPTRKLAKRRETWPLEYDCVA